MKIAPDKQLHLVAGLAIAVITMAIAQSMGSSKAPVFGFFAALIAGILKEVYDRWANAKLQAQNLPPAHDVDRYDVLATVVGGFVAALSWTLVLMVL